MPGDQLGPFVLVEKLGEGGMGIVYKARDTRLDRAALENIEKTIDAAKY